MSKVDIKNFSEDELREFIIKLGDKKYRADQIANWIYNQNAETWSDMGNIPLSLREKLEENASLYTLKESRRDVSSDGTVKWLFQTKDGYYIETVLIPTEDRNSVCISTQVGCGMGCKFCRTGTMGLKRHLEPGEIIEQYLLTRKFVREVREGELTNIIFMGMGEPFHNFENVETSIRWFHHAKYFQLSKKRITVSTSGLIDKIIKMADVDLPAQLAVSLNGTNDEMRQSIMPINKRYPIHKLLEAVDYYIQKTGNSVTFEFVLIKDITCTPEAARELVQIIRNRNCKVNAIALNASDDPNLHTPNAAEIEEFLNIVRSANKTIIIRQPRGRDIKAACGQLAVHQQKVA